MKSKEITPYFIYSQYGISYNKDTDILFYNGEIIRYFEDNSIIYNGDGTISGSFDFHIDKTNNGKIDVYAIRNHNNELTGVRIAYVTLPNNPKYNRAVQVYSENGNIQISQCSSTAMLDMGTKSGNINVNNCSSPQL